MHIHTTSSPNSPYRLLALTLAGLTTIGVGGCVGADESVDDPTAREPVAEADQAVTNGNINVPQDVARSVVEIIAGTYACSAIRVGPRMLLTAAHCVQQQGSTALYPSYQPGSGMSFGLKTTPFWPVSIVQHLSLKASATYVHPNWSWAIRDIWPPNAQGKTANQMPDVALIEVDPSSPGWSGFDTYLTQRKINIGYNPNNGRSLIIGGWGYAGGVQSGSSEYPHYGYTSVDYTTNNYIGVLGTKLNPSYGGMTHGDSGGPLLDNEGGTTVSWGSVVGVNSAMDFDATNQPPNRSVHTRMDAWEIRDWLMGFASKLNLEGQGKIRGHIDTVSISGGTRYVAGWACDWGVGQSIDVHVYGNGAYGAGGTMIAAGVANKASEAAVSNVCGTSGVPHRFNVAISAAHAGKSVWVHGISKSGNWNLTIDNSGKFFVP